VLTYEIETRTVDEVQTAAIFDTVAVVDMPAFFGPAFGEVAAYLSKWGAGPAGMPYARYHQLREGWFEVEAGFPAITPVAGEGRVEPSQLPACTVATTTHVGSYEDLGKAYEALYAWIAEHGGEPASDPWEVYLTGPGEPETRTQVFAPYRPATSS
jgi:effector-binding domain-containing protein